MKKFNFSTLTYLFSAKNSNERDFFADFTHMHKRETGSSCHFLYLLFSGICIGAALWQHGTPLFTLGMLALLLPAAFLIYIPYRFSGILLRRFLACLIFFGACFWMVHRLKNAVPVDLVFVEGIIIASFAFRFNHTAKDYNYLAGIGLLLLIYSGLIPRTQLLYLTPCAVGCLCIIFARERIQSLAGARNTVFLSPHSRFRNLGRTWHFYLLQILIAVPIFLVLFSLIPMRDMGNEGLLEVSFHTSRKSVMPPDLKKWLLQDKRISSTPAASRLISGDHPDTPAKSGKKKIQSDQPGSEFGSGRGAPPGKDLVFTAVMPVKLYHLAMLYDHYDGKTWHSSQDLRNARIHERKSRFYYRHNIESRYTIYKWISTKLYAPFRMKEFQQVISPELTNSDTLTVLLKAQKSSFNMELKEEKEYPKLPFQYNAYSELLIPTQQPPPGKPAASSPRKQPEIYPSAAAFIAYQKEQERLRQEKLRIAAEKRAALKKAAEERAARRRAALKKAAEERAARRKAALKKNASKRNTAKANKKPLPKPAVKKPAVKKAVIPKPVVKKPVVKKPVFHPAWLESLPVAHYLQLPETLSPRIAQLAQEIVKGLDTPFEKALALRDHLRKNYTYKLFAEPVPPGVEGVEYFLFERKEGHCEYFAAALTVLARTLGLPARVATGFSPGNYNTMTGKFEVYEYHAHAWSQIFIEHAGWLTFDAVPPGDVISETTPAGIGRFRDPFGDEWKIMPPELAPNALEHVQKILKEETKRLTKLEAAQKEAKEKQLTKKQEMLDGKKNEVKNTKSSQTLEEKKSSGIKQHMQNLFSGLKKQLKSFCFLALSLLREQYSAWITFTAAAVFLIFSRPICRLLRDLVLRFRAGRLIRQARMLQQHDPNQSIRCLYRAVRLLLILARMERKNNQELLAYAADTQKRYLALAEKKKMPQLQKRKADQRFSAHIRQVFISFYALEYGQCTAAPEEAERVWRSAEKIYLLLCKLYPGGICPAEKLLFRHPFGSARSGGHTSAG